MIIYQNGVKIGEFKRVRKGSSLVGMNILQDGDRIDIEPVYRRWFSYTNLGDIKILEIGSIVIFLLNFPPFIQINKLEIGDVDDQG